MTTTEPVHYTLKDANDALMQAIRADVAGDGRGWLETVRDAVRASYEVLEKHRHMAEEASGTLADATARKPRLMPASTRLNHEHADMLHRAAEIDLEIERQLAADDFNLELVRIQARVLHDIVLLHMLRTEALIYDAYFRTEGGEAG